MDILAFEFNGGHGSYRKGVQFAKLADNCLSQRFADFVFTALYKEIVESILLLRSGDLERPKALSADRSEKSSASRA